MRPMIATWRAAAPRAGGVLALALLLLQPSAARAGTARPGVPATGAASSAVVRVQGAPYPPAPVAGAQPGVLPAPPNAPGAAEAATPAEEGADQVVGLFAATCLKFPGDPGAVRGFLTTQGAPQMPAQARQAFLGNRAGQVFDTSYEGTRLALVSLDDGSCEAVAEFAGPEQVVDYLQEAMREMTIDAQPQGDFPDPKRPAVHQRVWQATLAGRPWVVSVVTAAQAPQASLGLHPVPPARRP